MKRQVINTLKAIGAAIVCTTVFCTAAVAQDKEEAAKYLEKAQKATVITSDRHGKKIFGYYQKSAELGNAIAQNKMGEFLLKDYCPKWARKSYSVEPLYHAYDATEAFQWFQKSAAQGFTPAKFHIAECTYRGWGTPKDEAKGMQLFVDVAELCFKKNYKNSVSYLWNCGLFYEVHGSNVYRSDLADKNADAAYVADVIQYFGYAWEELKWKKHPAFMRSLWRGNEKAVDALRVLADQGKQYAIDVFTVKEEDVNRINKLKKSMDKVLATGDPIVIPDADMDYINRIHWTHRATETGKTAYAIRRFYVVNKALALDPTTKHYAGGLLAADYADVDRQTMREAIKICQENKNSEYHTYYDNCIPILEKKTAYITSLEKSQNAQLREGISMVMQQLTRPMRERQAEYSKQETAGNAMSVPEIKKTETGSHGREIDTDNNFTDYDYYIFQDGSRICVYHRYQKTLLGGTTNYFYPEHNKRDIKYETAVDAARAGWVYQKDKDAVRTIGQKAQ